MTKTMKSVIAYCSQTGNTEKVALSFKKAFEKKGWQCDLFKINDKTDVYNPPFDFGDYDFFCVGSWVFLELPVEEIIKFMCKNPYSGHGGQPTVQEVARQRLQRNNPKYLPPGERLQRADVRPPGKIIPGPKKGVVFATYSGMHLGPKEALAALAHLEVEQEHLGFECVGRFCCPGKQMPHGEPREDQGDRPAPIAYHEDINSRPNERDLIKAEMFIEEILEKYY